MKKKLFFVLMFTLLFSMTVGTVAVAKNTTTEGIYAIPGGGTWRRGHKSVVKGTWSNKAHFKAKSMSASLGFKAELSNSKSQSRSKKVSLKAGKWVTAKKNTGSKHYKYYPHVRTNKLEWAKKSNLTLSFQAD